MRIGGGSAVEMPRGVVVARQGSLSRKMAAISGKEIGLGPHAATAF